MANAHLRDTKQDPKNARRHNPRNVGMVESSIQREGFGRSILLANDGTIIAGNATAEAAASAGLEDMIVVDSDGTKVIAVRRTDVEPGSDRFHKLAIADNRAADLAEWDASVLQSLADDIDLTPFFRDDELDALLASLNEPTVGLSDPDDVPAVPDEPVTKPGDLWVLGRHRLLCGDATVVTDVERLMDGAKADMVFTDPPYNTGIQQGRTASGWGIMANDAMSSDRFAAWLDDVAMIASVSANGDWYVCCDFKSFTPTVAAFSKARGDIRSCIVWAKDNFGLGSGYRRQHEFVAYWGSYAGNTESDLWSIPKVRGDEYEHPTQKPTALAERAITNSSKANDLILDLFGGSGSTLIACEQAGRRCAMMEIDPHYCDVIVNRWQNFTGSTAVLAHDHAMAAD